MISHYNAHLEMLIRVAKALGKDMLNQVAFVGGSTTGLLITDTATKEEVRYTSDVDLIISVVGYTGWHNFVANLNPLGFKVSMEDEVSCRLRLGDLQVDFMPDDAEALGFTNKWYRDALLNAVDYNLEPDLTIKILTAPFFLATKFEAFKGRGEGDVLASHDIEDILNVIDGREEVIDEVRSCPIELRNYIAEQIQKLLEHDDIQYAVQSCAQANTGRELLIFERLEKLAGR